MNQSVFKTREFPVTVYYGNSLKQMTDATKFDRVDERINDQNFRRSGSRKEEMTAVAIELDLRLYDIEMVTTRGVIQFLSDFGYRPATIDELLAFSEQHSESILNASIIALGSFCLEAESNKVLSPAFQFCEHETLPDLILESAYDDGWILESVYFLAVKR